MTSVGRPYRRSQRTLSPDWHLWGVPVTFVADSEDDAAETLEERGLAVLMVEPDLESLEDWCDGDGTGPYEVTVESVGRTEEEARQQVAASLALAHLPPLKQRYRVEVEVRGTKFVTIAASSPAEAERIAEETVEVGAVDVDVEAFAVPARREVAADG